MSRTSGVPEEVAGPIPRARVHRTPLQLHSNHSASSAQKDVDSLLIAERPITQAVVRLQKLAEEFFRVSPSYRNEFNRYVENAEIPASNGLESDVFDVLGHVFSFQDSSVSNQRDNAISMLTSRLSRALNDDPTEDITVEDASLVLEVFRDEMLSNYMRWCGFMDTEPASLAELFDSAGVPPILVADYTMATESALMLLIWGEAGNLRFCPEFLCFLYHNFCKLLREFIKRGGRDMTLPRYLDDVIVPMYELLADELKGKGRVIDHTKTRNYDDFNEIFWQESCKEINVGSWTKDTSKEVIKKRFHKTFMERQSWLVPIFSFWRVHLLHIVGLHLMIVAARCHLAMEEDTDDGEDGDVYSDSLCDTDKWFSPVITLYASAFVRDLWDVSQTFFVAVGTRGGLPQFSLNVIRAGIKGGITFALLVMYFGTDADLYVSGAAVLLLLALIIEGIMVTEIWWGINTYGNWTGSTERTCKAGGFAACCPSAFRQSCWALIGSMLGINSVNLYTQIHALPPLTKRFRYICFWALVILTKVSFSYFVVIKELVESSYILYNAGATTYDLSVYGSDWVLTDTNNQIYVIFLWLGSGLVFFLDTHIWFVIWSNVAAAVEGVRRRVGEVNDSAQVIRAFSGLYKEFFSYSGWVKTTQHTRFAHIWNEIVDSMREEDIINDREKSQLRYFLIQLRLPQTVMSRGQRKTFDLEARPGEWSDPFTLLPEFLMSGAVQRTVQRCKEFGARKDLEDLSESKLQGEIRKFLSFAEENNEEQVTTEMVRQLSATTFTLLDALCRNEPLSRSIWNVHRALFAGDVEQPGKGIRKKGILGGFSPDRDPHVARNIKDFSKNDVLFKIKEFPGFVKAMGDLVKALLVNIPSKKEWDKKVAAALVKMAEALVKMLSTNFNTSNELQVLFQEAKMKVEDWKMEFGGKQVAPGALAFKSYGEEFLRRTEGFILSPADSQPGLVKGAEARRRIIFFVNSLFTDQPRRKPVLRMPALSTLTPYYKEDVVSSVEDFRKETQDGVSVLEYLRSIYPDEFLNFAERIQETIREKTGRILVREAHEDRGKGQHVALDVDVVQPMLDGVMDLELGENPDRATVVANVKSKVRKAVEAKMISILQEKKKQELGEGKRSDEDVIVKVNDDDVRAAITDDQVEGMILELQLWASYRGQTLSRTVRGIMYYRQAVRLLATVENIDEFQPKEGNYVFGTSKKSTHEGEGAGHEFADVVRQAQEAGEVEANSRQRSWLYWPRFNSPRVQSVDDSAGGQAQSVHMEAALDRENQALIEELDGGRSPQPSTGQGRLAGRPPVHSSSARGARGGSKAVRRNTREGRDATGVTRNDPERAAEVRAKFQRAVRQAVAVSREQQRRGNLRRQGTSQDLSLPSSDFNGFIQVKDPKLDKDSREYGLTDALAEAKYRYVVSCQVYGDLLKSDKVKAGYIDMLAKNNPGLRIAYVDSDKGQFFSVLLKYDPEQAKMVEEYRIRLPGKILVGEGKPNNQNHAIIFTRGEAIQAIDMNQDAALEDAIKIRQLMEEFRFAKRGVERGRNIGRIVGFREHVFTHDVSAVANFFSLQELNFVSATQRALDNPLHIRFHYGHPDVFDRVSAITMGGISKPSKGLHLSEDIFAGFNYVLRGGEATQSDYIQVAKGRDTGVAQVTGFTAKISMGNGMQARSREVYRLANQLDIFRLLSFYYSSVGGFMTQVLLIVAVFLYMYAKLYIVFDPEISVNSDVVNALSTQFIFQLGFLLILPIPLLLSVEQGLQVAFGTLFDILIRLAPFFFIFSAGTNGHFVNSAVQYGQAEYKATGRGFVIEHEKFVGMFRLYLTSHFNIAFELLVVLIVYALFTSSGYGLETFSVYLFVVGLLYTPVLFNPNGLDFSYASKDFSEWVEWMNSPVPYPDKSWLEWYRGECEAQYNWPFLTKIEASIRRCRLLILVYGFMTGFSEASDDQDGWPGTVTISAGMFAVVLLMVFPSWVLSLSIVQKMRRCCCPPKDLKFASTTSKWSRLFNVLILLAVIVGVIVLASIGIIDTFRQIVYFILAFLILVYFCAQWMVLWSKDCIKSNWVVRQAFKSVHMCIGIVVMIPILVLSFFPIFVALQTRMLFNENFSSRFDIAKIFAKQRKRNDVKKMS